ncbi:MAG: hypothetical protein LBH43_06435 [Treponema sp.]|jgi:hypothetical protein|nr:hypothetical protein [Treponema sp.]
MKMNVLNFIAVGLITITLGCNIEPDKDEITLGEIIFSPKPTTDKADIVGKEYIGISCKTSDNKSNENFYYTLDGSEPTEDSSSWNIADKIPQDFYFNDYIKNIKVLAVYNDNGHKIFKTGEANYNFKYLRLFSSSYSEPTQVQMGKGYYNYGYFRDGLGRDSHTSYYKPSQNGKLNIYATVNLRGTLTILKNSTKINTSTTYPRQVIDVNETDIITISISQGNQLQIGGNPNWNYDISLE